MPYLIDGHNLIPKVAGLSLKNIDDEVELIQLLQQFCRVKRQKVEVFFDRAAPGQAGTRSAGMVTAHFVSTGSTADNAIRKRLQSLGRSARGWKVVSSDRQVQAEALAAHAEVITAEDFARQLKPKKGFPTAKQPGKEQGLSTNELEEWLKIFGDNS